MTDEIPDGVDTLVSDGETLRLRGSARTLSSDSHPSTAAESRVADRYEILALIGQGGAGTVYKVRDLELSEVVALKTLHGDLLRDERAIDRSGSQAAERAHRVGWLRALFVEAVVSPRCPCSTLPSPLLEALHGTDVYRDAVETITERAELN